MAYGMTQARRDPLSRLDAWVIEELEALGHTPAKARRDDRPRRRREAEPELDPPFAEAANDGALPLDENQFIQRVSEWLSGRPNADLILEEIWRNVVVPEVDEARAADDLDEDRGDDLAESAIAAAAGEDADVEGETPEGPAGDAPANDEPQA